MTKRMLMTIAITGLMAVSTGAFSMTKGEVPQEQHQVQIQASAQQEEKSDHTAIWVALITTLGGIATAVIVSRRRKA